LKSKVDELAHTTNTQNKYYPRTRERKHEGVITIPGMKSIRWALKLERVSISIVCGLKTWWIIDCHRRHDPEGWGQVVNVDITLEYYFIFYHLSYDAWVGAVRCFATVTSTFCMLLIKAFQDNCVRPQCLNMHVHQKI